MNKLLIAALLTMMATSAYSDPQLYDRQTGKYLGNLSSNQFDPNSTSNQFGRYGSQFSPDSIVMFSCRSNPECVNDMQASTREMVEYMNHWKLPFDEVQLNKPLYITI
jgi:hypothetical protein